VAFLDQDDIWHRDHLSLLSTILEEFTECPAAVAGCFHFYQENKLFFLPPALDPQPFYPWEAFPTNSVATPSAVVTRRSALNLINGWPTQFTGSAVDYYTWLRLSVNQSLMRNPSVTVGYRRHNNSQGMMLRLKNMQLIDTHITTLEDALSYRLSVRSQDTLLLKNRLESLTNMSDIVKGAITFNQSLLVDSVITFEERLTHESTAFIGSMCNLLLWFLYPYLDPQEAVLTTLLEYWPNKAYKTRQCFRERIALSRILPKHLLAHPFDLRFWALLVEFANIISKKFLRL
jgi:hypothetical protein